MKRFLLIGMFSLALALSSCTQQNGEHAKYKAYVYKQLEPDGLLCIFYSNYPGIAERNAQQYVEMSYEKYGDVLTVKTEPY